MYIILCVIDQTEHLSAVLESWHQAGVNGATLLESAGLHHHRKHGHLPMRYLFGAGEPAQRGNVTVFAIVEREDLVQRCLEATESVIGDLNNPNTGVFAAWPLAFVKGASRPTGTGTAGES
jgi:hypothetical protein